MTIELEYYVRFGPGDCSETFDWEVELTPEEEVAAQMAIANQESLEDAVPGAVNRAYAEIYKMERQNFPDGEMDGELIVHVVEPDYDE